MLLIINLQQYALKHLRMKRNLNLNSCSLKLCLADYVCKRTAIPAKNTAVHIICHYVIAQVKKNEGSKPRKYLGNGELDNHCTSLLKVSSDIVKKKYLVTIDYCLDHNRSFN